MRLLKTITISIFILLLCSTLTSAMEVIPRKDLGFDDALAEEQIIYSQPGKIYVTQISTNNNEFKNDIPAWIRSIYYYSITRLKLNDIPFSYLIDNGGNVYEVAKGGVGANPGLQNGENVILIGILDDGSSITPRVSTSLTELSETLSYKYGIKNGQWDFVDLKIVKEEGKRSYLVSQSSQLPALESIKSSMGIVRWSDKEHLEYKASIVDITYSKELEISKQLEVRVTVKNENDFPWFADTSQIYLSTEDSKDSMFSVNSIWDSFSRPTHIQDKYVKPGDTTEIVFNMLGKSRPGEYTQGYILIKDNGAVFEGSKFSVTFSITAGENKLVEVVSPEYGFVNIRECRWYSCEKVEVANDGDVFIMSKEEEGWYEIFYSGESKGWVYQKYIKEL